MANENNPAFHGASASGGTNSIISGGPRPADHLFLCESGSLNCTGINPCEKCYVFVMVKILPSAMRAGGFGKERPGEPSVRDQMRAFFKMYDETWKKMLLEKIAAPISSGVTTPALLAFIEFQRAFRKEQEAADKLAAEGSSSPPVFHPSKPAKQPQAQHKVNKHGASGKTKSKKSKTAVKGTKLVRGDVKGIAVKAAEESLASSKHSRVAGNGVDDPGLPGLVKQQEKH